MRSEVEVVEPDIIEEAQPLVDLLQDRLGNLALLRGELRIEAKEPCLGVGHAHGDGGGDVGIGDADAQCLFI